MAIHSTSKMLARMVGKSKSQDIEQVDIEQPELFDSPQLKPSPAPDMANTLANILGSSPTKKHTILD